MQKKSYYSPIIDLVIKLTKCVMHLRLIMDGYSLTIISHASLTLAPLSDTIALNFSTPILLIIVFISTARNWPV